MPFTEEERRARKNARQREYAKRTGYAATIKSNKKNTKLINIRFILSSEGDMLEFLSSKENVSGYIKSLIRQDMNRTK